MKIKNQECDLHPPLVIAIGNDGRRDDGLGWAFGRKLEGVKAASFRIEYRYQLQIEDALLVSEYPLVIFVDACRENLKAGFDLSPLYPAGALGFTTHQMSPESILALSRDLYRATPRSFLLRISGKNWDLAKGLSKAAQGNLDEAFDHFTDRFCRPVP